MKFIAGLLVCCAIILTTGMSLSEAATTMRPPNTEPEKEIAEKQDKPPPLETEPVLNPFDPDQRENKVKVIKRCLPKFPGHLLDKGICKGTVTINHDVTDVGKATNLAVIVSKPKGEFTKAAKEALMCTEFAKKEVDTEPENFRKNLTATYSFKGCD